MSAKVFKDANLQQVLQKEVPVEKSGKYGLYNQWGSCCMELSSYWTPENPRRSLMYNCSHNRNDFL